ncbi:restriction endonuclease subunit S [Bacillus sp. ISL-47]|uniref:restriction endonuclease subunit S n=1 Tax=Bacillus sp. ISL-47 TaxID=2819130 RepID=UPI001BE57CAB|nr:restriction endonuclease subunit S [Bacillus sp. ISL-47]MBT2688365.1 restriction endonuclease subunit S [Bacillus sp. ISL-47]MBT2710524.1 restriction endonuclease subunit S [Pseudomonas sp. ISL-84]
MDAQDLKNSVLQLAVSGKLVEQREEEGSAKELLEQIKVEKEKLIKQGKIKKQKKLPDIKEDEIPFDIPESWVWVRFGEIVNVVSARRVHQSDWRKEGIPFYRAREIGKLAEFGKVDNELFIDEELFNKFAESGVPKAGDLMVTAVGTLGKTYIVKDNDIFYYKDASVICLENFCDVSSEYIKLIMESKLMETQIKNNSGGTTVSTLTMVRMNMYCLPLPPLEEQKRVVAKVEELMSYVEKYDKAYTEVEELNQKFPGDMQKSILQYAIEGKLVEQREEEGAAEELYQLIQEEKEKLVKEGKIRKEKSLPEIREDDISFEIPESWKWVSIGQVCSNIMYGTSKKSSKEGKIAVLRMGNLQGGKIDYSDLVYSLDDGDIEKYKLEKNDLLFNRTNSRDLVGKTAIYKEELPAIYAGYLVRLTPVIVISDYINFVMQSDYYWRYCQTVKSDAIGQSNINAEKLKRFVFPLPPLEEQKRIVAKIEELLPYNKQLINII